jgi:hypothetical protein
MTRQFNRTLLCAAALVPLTALGLLLACPRPQATVGDDWTPERLRAELAARGLLYEGREVTLAEAHRRGGLDPGYYLKRPEDCRTWEELAGVLRGPATGSMRGFVAVTVAPRGPRPVNCAPEEGRIQLGPLLLHGDPAELCRILEALGLSPERAARPDGTGISFGDHGCGWDREAYPARAGVSSHSTPRGGSWNEMERNGTHGTQWNESTRIGARTLPSAYANGLA